MMTRSKADIIRAIACAGMLVAGPVFAAGPSPENAVPPTPPNDERGVRPGEGPGEGTSTPQGDLSDQLSRSGGVIKPRTDIDPNMHQPPPETGPRSMPVIPPPGTQGNSLDVKPK